jgi:hypothetical protein
MCVSQSSNSLCIVKRGFGRGCWLGRREAAHPHPHVFYLVLDESFLWLFIYETKLDIFSYEIKFEIGTM